MHTLSQLQTGQLLGTKTLKLSCGLTELPTEILDLADTLEILDLSGNRLTHLPHWLVHLKKLRIAFFSHNEFTQFPSVLGQCTHLEMIGFKACHIRTIPEKAIPPATRWLILTDNKIAGLPASIGQCTHLQKLMLAGNRLKELPAEMAALQQLELLRISANELTELPTWLFSLPRLAWLAFSGNPCTSALHQVVALPEISWETLELAEPLGEGASGIISKARWQQQAPVAGQKTVAVKMFKGAVTSDGLPRDEMETCLAAATHPHLVPVLGKIIGHPAQKQGLVFDLIPAGYRNLGGPPSFETCTRDIFPKGTSFYLPKILKISLGIASVAAHLHARGLLHGDLYAHNTLVNDTGHALLGDFGAATRYDGASAFGPALERIEVRAFGYLLEDLLNHLAPQKTILAGVASLHQLKQECLQPEGTHRPGFVSIHQRLEEISRLSMSSA